MKEALVTVVIVIASSWAFMHLKSCVERHEVAYERLKCLELNSGRPTNDLTKICGGVVP